MKRFLKTTLLILSVSFMLNVFLDIGITRFLNHSQAGLYKEWNSIIHDAIDADLLVLGSSRAWAQYDPCIMDSLLLVKSYNLGLDGGTVNRQIVKYKVFRHYQKNRPSILIINFDYWSNWEKNRFQREQFFPYLEKLYMRGLIKEHEYMVKRELYVPMYRYYHSQGISNLFNTAFGSGDKYKKECWYKGYYWGNPLDWDGSELTKVKSVKFDPMLDVVDKFDAFLSELQKDSVKVIFVSSPIYIEVSKMTVNLPEFYSFRNQFSEKYDIPVLDYIYDSICYDTAYFYNATHLNKTGAELFTTKLCHDLDSLGLLK